MAKVRTTKCPSCDSAMCNCAYSEYLECTYCRFRARIPSRKNLKKLRLYLRLESLGAKLRKHETDLGRARTIANAAKARADALQLRVDTLEKSLRALEATRKPKKKKKK